jgi:FkbM family methyltransferase
MSEVSNGAFDRISDDTFDHVPEEYAEVLRLLRLAWSSDELPPTTIARAKVIRGGGGASSGGSFTLANPRFMKKGGNAPPANDRFPELAQALFALEDKLRDGKVSSASCAVNCHAEFVPHVDSGTAANESLTYTVGLGSYQGGDLVVEDTEMDIRYAPITYDGWHQRHWTQPFDGERFSLVWFTATFVSKRQAKAERAADMAAQWQAKVDKAADIAAKLGLVYRSSSTDVQAILEVLGDSPCYLRDEMWSPQGHDVLDAGAHIGSFSRYALDAGARSVRSFEPEPSNAEFARQNAPQAQLIEAALVNSDTETPTEATLVLGRSSDGAANTWRHALEAYNTCSGEVETRTVNCLSFYDILGDATFVKLDIEGAELAILDSFTPGAWSKVSRLVFEYSFTKRRPLAPFRGIVKSLELEGFSVSYDFKGTLDELDEWPGRTDALVFCSKD